MSEGGSVRWKTHRETWASLLNELDTVEKDVESIFRYWRLCAQATKELNEVLKTKRKCNSHCIS